MKLKESKKRELSQNEALNGFKLIKMGGYLYPKNEAGLY